MRPILGMLLISVTASLYGQETQQAQQPGAEKTTPDATIAPAKRCLDTLLSFMQETTEGQTTRLWGRHRVERIEVKKYDWRGGYTVETVAYELKVGDTKYQVSIAGKDAPPAPWVGFWVRRKRAPEAVFGDADRDGRVDVGEFPKKKEPQERRRFSAQEGAEHREFWQREYEMTLDELCRYLGVATIEPERLPQ